MGQKVSPISLRIAVSKDWRAKWFSNKDFASFLEEDIKIRKIIKKKLARRGVAKVVIERGANSVNIIIYTSKPGLIIGKGGAGIEELKKKIKQKLGIKQELKVNIEEVRDINLQAQVIANTIVEQLEKRVAFRKLMKQSLEQIMNAGAKGAKVAIGGRLNGADIARTEHLSNGKIPLQNRKNTLLVKTGDVEDFHLLLIFLRLLALPRFGVGHLLHAEVFEQLGRKRRLPHKQVAVHEGLFRKAYGYFLSL